MATLLSTAPNYRGAGIHQYSMRLLRHLPGQAPQFDYHAFVMDRAYEPPPGVAVTRPSRLSPTPTGRILWEQTQVARAARHLDLLHGFAYALPVLSHTPSVVTIHDLTFLLFPEAFPKNKQRYLAHITARSCRKARTVIADSQATANDLQRLLNVPREKIRVIYTGVDDAYQPLPSEQVEQYRRQKGWPDAFILMVGTLEPRKNHLGLINAYARYREMAQSPLPLLIGGGKGWHFDRIFQRVQALGLEDAVQFLGFVPWEDLPWLYNAATLFVYPSRYEGFGLPVAEAMRCGTPVITSNVSSLPEVAGDAALTIDPDNPDELAAAMVLVLEKEPQRLQVMREKGFHQAARFTWEQTAAETADVYARILHQPHG
jgi:glycosyltransferase involved in cell wall biosynthesis